MQTFKTYNYIASLFPMNRMIFIFVNFDDNHRIIIARSSPSSLSSSTSCSSSAIACVRFCYYSLWLVHVCVRGQMRLAPFFSHIHTRAHKTVSRLLQTITTYVTWCVFQRFIVFVWYRKRALTSGAMLFCIQIEFHKSRDSKHISLPPRTCSKPNSRTRDCHSVCVDNHINSTTYCTQAFNTQYAHTHTHTQAALYMQMEMFSIYAKLLAYVIWHSMSICIDRSPSYYYLIHSHSCSSITDWVRKRW